MTKSKKIFTAAILSAIIISFSGCDIPENTPVSTPDVTISSESSSSESSSLSESSSVSEPEPEPEPVPEPVVSLSATETEPGDYIVLRAENLDLSVFSFTDFSGTNRRFFENEGGWYCLIPIDTAFEPGVYSLEFTAGDFTYSSDITVLERFAPTQYLVVEQKTLDATLEDQAVREAFEEFYQKYRWYFSDVPLWDGSFAAPLGNSWYKETTSFGTFRTFSNGKTEWHNATDMAAGGGTPIYATNSGNIVFADWLGLTGYTIIIDHGCGVLSWHYHLSSLNVSEGDYVEKNSFIGRVGTTGLSTGNHLHFGITVGGTFVDPMDMVGSQPDLEFWKVAEE